MPVDISGNGEAAGARFDTVVSSAFYHVFQDDEGPPTRYAQTLHGATGQGGTVDVRIRNATTSTAVNGKARRPNAIIGGRRAQMRDGAAQEATAFNRITRNRRRGLNQRANAIVPPMV